MTALSWKITTYIKTNSNIKDTEDLEKIDYALQAIFSEMLKLIVLFTLFFIIGNLKHLVFSMMILFTTRIFLGGYHSKTTIGCLFLSTVMFVITSFIAPMIPMINNIFYYLFAILSLLIIVFYSPFPNKKRSIKSKKRRRIYKAISIFSISLWLIVLLFYIKDTTYFNCGFFTIIVQLIQIIPIKKGM